MGDDFEVGGVSQGDKLAIVSKLKAEQAISTNNAQYFRALLLVLESQGRNDPRYACRRDQLEHAARGAEMRTQALSDEIIAWEQLV